MGCCAAFLESVTDRLTYANIVATLALFIALGGVSYAAISLPAASVGPRQLRTGAVTLGKLGFPLASATTRTNAVTVHGFQCAAVPGQPIPPCPPPLPATLASTTIALSHPAKVLILATSELYAPASSGNPSQVQLYGRADQNQLLERTTANVSSNSQGTATYQSVTALLLAGRHTLQVFATDSGPDAVANSTTMVALALPSS